MLKKICRLFLGLMVCTGSAWVTPTYASSAFSLNEPTGLDVPIVISHIQPGGLAGAKDELVAIHNNGPAEVDITDWCLVNKSSVAFVCFSKDDYENDNGQVVQTRFVIPGYGTSVAVSQEYSAAHLVSDGKVVVIYMVTNQSSGSIVNSSDTLSLVNATGDVIDMRSWSSAPTSGRLFVRVVLFAMPMMYTSGTMAADWTTAIWGDVPDDTTERRSSILQEVEDDGDPGSDLEPGNDLDDETVNDGSENQPLSPIVITELFPNPSGSDAGKEFVEFYNPSESEQSLAGLRIRVDASSVKWYALPDDSVIGPRAYIAFLNSTLGFTLINTNGAVQLYQDDTALGESIEYTSPKDDWAWALINETWQYTSLPTPGAENQSSPLSLDENDAVSTQKPCASNQYRNPETGRCKLISSSVTTLTPCKEGQVRNLETNRCRSVSASKTALVPCKEGQERNTETNRCRNSVQISNADYSVKGVETKAGKQMQWYYWAAIIGVVVLVVAYVIWEWRDEISHFIQKLWRHIRKIVAR